MGGGSDGPRRFRGSALARPFRRPRPERTAGARRPPCPRPAPPRTVAEAFAVPARRASHPGTARAPSASQTAPRRHRRAARPSRLDDPPRLGVDGDTPVAHPAAQGQVRDPPRARPRATTARRPRPGSGSRPRPPSARARTRAGRSRTAPVRQAAALLRGTPSRRPCPSRCGGRRPRARTRARRRRRTDRSHAARRSRQTRAAPRAVVPAATRSRRREPRACSRSAARSPRSPRSRPSRRRRTRTTCRSADEAAPGRIRSVDLDRVRGEIVRSARGDRLEPFRHAEPERELLVVTRRPHRDRDGLAADTDLERLLDGDEVGLVHAARQAKCIDCGRVEYAGTAMCSLPRASAYSRGEPRLSPRVAGVSSRSRRRRTR